MDSTRIEQSEADLKNHLNDTLRFLQKSAKEYDNGDVAEAKQMALQLRKLLYDKKNATSILSLLKIKDKINFLDTGIPYNPANLLSQLTLVSVNYKSDGKNTYAAYHPLLDQYQQLGRVSKWYSFDT